MKNFRLFILALGLVFAKGAFSQTINFTTPGTTTWTVPAGVTSISIYCWGGGGAGGGAKENYVSGGTSSPNSFKSAAGGGAGGFNKIINYSVTPGQILNITVGAGGSYNSSSSLDGTNGGTTSVTNSSFSTIIYANGGNGGIGNNSFSGSVPTTSGGSPNGVSSVLGGVFGSQIKGGSGGSSTCIETAPYPCLNQFLGSGAGGAGGVVSSYSCQGANGSNGQNRGGGGGGAVTATNTSQCGIERNGGNGGRGAVAIFISKITVPSVAETFSVCQGEPIPVESFLLQGVNVSSVQITPPQGIEVSLSPTFSTTIGTNISPLSVISNAGFTINSNTLVYYRLQSTSTIGTSTGMIVCSSSNAPSQNISVTTEVGNITPQILSQPTGVTFCEGIANNGVLNLNSTGSSFIWQYLNGSNWINVSNNIPNNFQYQNIFTDSISISYNSSLAASSYSLYYRCIVKNLGCSFISDSVMVTILRNPSVTVNSVGATVFCQGNSVNLNASPNVGLSYQWKKNGIDMIGENTSIITATTTGSYTVLVADINGCSKLSSSTIVTVRPLPIANISITNSPILCDGNLVVMNANTGSGLTYQWQSNGANLQNESTSSYSSSLTGSYSVVVTNNWGCSATSSPLIINPLPSLSISYSNSTSFCQGEITENILAVGQAQSYEWNTGDTTQSIIVNEIGLYTVLVTDMNGCQNSDSVQITVNPLPNINAGNNQTICQGDNTTLNATGATSYSWNNNVTNNVSFTPTTTNNYVVTGTDANGCQDSDTVQVTVNPTSTSQFTQTAVGSYTLNGQIYTQSGTYTQVLQNSIGCDSIITLNLTISSSGLGELTSAKISIAPNPTTSLTTLTVSQEFIGKSFSITDFAGRVVLQGKIQSLNQTIDLQKVARGSYFLTIENTNLPGFKIIKE